MLFSREQKGEAESVQQTLIYVKMVDLLSKV